MKKYIANNRIQHVFIIVACSFLLLLQKTGYNFDFVHYFSSFFGNIRKQIFSGENKDDSEYQKLADMAKKIIYLQKYDNIYTALKPNFSAAAILEPVYLYDVQNMHYLFANTNNEVFKNDIVVDKSMALVGRIVAVNSKNVKIQLLNDVKFSAPAFATVGGIYGIVSANDDEKCELIFEILNSKNKPEDNDLIITSGENNLVPRGIDIGTVNIINDKICVRRKASPNIDTLVVIRPKSVQDLDKEFTAKTNSDNDKTEIE